MTSHHLKDLHSRVDILQPCVSFNRVNTYQYYRERVYKLESPVADRFEAMKTAETWGERIPIGIIYKHEGIPVRGIRWNLFGNPVSKEEMIRLLTARHANRV